MLPEISRKVSPQLLLACCDKLLENIPAIKVSVLNIACVASMQVSKKTTIMIKHKMLHMLYFVEKKRVYYCTRQDKHPININFRTWAYMGFWGKFRNLAPMFPVFLFETKPLPHQSAMKTKQQYELSGKSKETGLLLKTFHTETWRLDKRWQKKKKENSLSAAHGLLAHTLAHTSHRVHGCSVIWKLIAASLFCMI